MKKVLIYFMFIFVGNPYGFGQCNSQLVETAAANSGKDAIYIKEFKVKLDKGTIERPAPVARFTTMLNEGMHYRFNVANATDYEGEAILQIFDHGKMLGSTYNVEKHEDNKAFDFICPKTKVYKVLMSFKDGKAGCAVGILSMVINDTTKFISPSLSVATKNSQVLYIGIDNPVKIMSSGVPDGSIDVGISKGYIAEDSVDYVARVFEEGKTTITVAAKDSIGKVKETGAIDFQVVKIPTPQVTLLNSHGGLINKQKLLQLDSLELQLPKGLEKYKFEITEFIISDKNDLIHGIRSNSHKISDKQKKLIEKLPAGSTLFVKGIKIKAPDETVRDLETIGFILE